MVRPWVTENKLSFVRSYVSLNMVLMLHIELKLIKNWPNYMTGLKESMVVMLCCLENNFFLTFVSILAVVISRSFAVADNGTVGSDLTLGSKRNCFTRYAQKIH